LLAETIRLGNTSRHCKDQLESVRQIHSKTVDDLLRTRALLVEARRLLENVVVADPADSGTVNNNTAAIHVEDASGETHAEAIIEYLAATKAAVSTASLSTALNNDSLRNSATTAINADAAVPEQSFSSSSSSLRSSSHHERAFNPLTAGGSSHERTTTAPSPLSNPPTPTLERKDTSGSFDWKRLGRGALLDRIKLSHQNSHESV
jgi:hypothetical protein